MTAINETYISKREVREGIKVYTALARYHERMSHMKNPAQRKTLAKVVVEEFGELRFQRVGNEVYDIGCQYFEYLHGFIRQCKNIAQPQKETKENN